MFLRFLVTTHDLFSSRCVTPLSASIMLKVLYPHIRFLGHTAALICIFSWHHSRRITLPRNCGLHFLRVFDSFNSRLLILIIPPPSSLFPSIIPFDSFIPHTSSFHILYAATPHTPIPYPPVNDYDVYNTHASGSGCMLR